MPRACVSQGKPSQCNSRKPTHCSEDPVQNFKKKKFKLKKKRDCPPRIRGSSFPGGGAGEEKREEPLLYFVLVQYVFLVLMLKTLHSEYL